MTKYICHNDRYCPDADVFDSVEEFLDMCEECFGERPSLIVKFNGGNPVWIDEESGAMVLWETEY